MEHTTTAKKNRRLASGSLAVMAAGFAATLPFPNGVSGLLHAGFEAGVIGGLADWFAVTALFRHPLGIPIPHTALLPKNRKKMSEGIVRVVQDRLLAKESMIEKLAQVQLAAQLLPAVRNALKSAVYSDRLPYFLEQAIRGVDTDKLVPFVSSEIRGAIERIDLHAVLHRLVDKAIEDGTDERVFDLLLERAETWASSEALRRELGASAMQLVKSLNLGGLMQFAVNAFIGYLDEDKLGTMVQSFILNKIAELKVPSTQRRAALMNGLRKGLVQLLDNLSESGQINTLRDRMLDSFQMEEKITDLIVAWREKGVEFVHSDSFSDTVWPFIERFIDRLEENEDLIREAEQWIKHQVISMIERNHDKIGTFVKENIDRLDNDQLVELIEDKVGQDLQWIRVNGALCGFLIGIVLRLIEQVSGYF
ncbi:hypothetical protein Back11_42240 [Paenibacillus baekrokdamisoli]|uniref:Uncharacterized protein n=1 Tax=Paenibacillus baekrokdamisoli TaxID=1712516 RepID=A0A3G9JIM6_9BACL|nr:DUF445 domain-containing protein [Paenibacillus baekrokdamisoli]MBB3068077.1 uncharacterized membrane-anchored protein YjiN (DUF445 family) [Paenibacillus baekrokdamisoli]BBH22879.1 hypothetical protein Back11_42240 [Paenibacillus baekrokdamisoli]